ncbi:MAG: AAA family ATPase [Candidatus Latescibacteria bacterium]|nr:AAA family ATPase [Candidatus Latescibacterota bacterium]
MKIAVSGKGGVGKTSFAALLGKFLHQAGYRVLAVDADPDANLAATLGFPDASDIVPMVEMKELIEERMGTKPGGFGALFKLNPKVDDLPAKYCLEHNGIRLMVMGQIRKGGSGCFCPENAFVRRLLGHLLMEEKDVLIVDMEAGIEHLTRGTSESVDVLIVVVEPGMRSIETAHTVKDLAADLGIKTVLGVANKVRGPQDRAFILEKMQGIRIIGFVPYSEDILMGNMGDRGIDVDRIAAGPVGQEMEAVRGKIEKLGAG